MPGSSGQLDHVVGQADHLTGTTHPLQPPPHTQLTLGVAAHGPHLSRPHPHHRVGPATANRHHLVGLEDLDTARLDDVVVVSEPQLAPLVTPEGEDPAGLGDHRGVLVPTGDQLHLVILDPELAGSIVGKLGLPEGEDGARVGYLRVVHALCSVTGGGPKTQHQFGQ